MKIKSFGWGRPQKRHWRAGFWPALVCWVLQLVGLTLACPEKSTVFIRIRTNIHNLVFKFSRKYKFQHLNHASALRTSSGVTLKDLCINSMLLVGALPFINATLLVFCCPSSWKALKQILWSWGNTISSHAAGPDSIPVGTSFLGEVFSGFFLTYKTNVLQVPEYHLAIIIIIIYGTTVQWSGP